MNVRPAQEEDFGTVTRLLEQLGRPVVSVRTRADCKQIFGEQLADPNTEHLVAVTDRDMIVGFCSLHFRSRLNRPDPQAWVPDLIVDDARRGRGTARLLLAAAEERARERGCFELAVESDSYSRNEAELLYTFAGMEEAGKAFRKAL
jgi:GNAT superfamily N-acetyltransferase